MDDHQYDGDTESEEEHRLEIDDGSNPNVSFQWGVFSINFFIFQVARDD